MKVIDLNSADGSEVIQQSQVCIIGAGAAGLYLAVRLIELGIDVIVMEAGDRNCVDGKMLGVDVEFSAEYYSGANEGRFFGIGGSTSKWGGALVPHIHTDVLTDEQSPVWQHIVNKVKEHTSVVLQTLGFSQEPLFRGLENRYFPSQARILKQAGIMPMSTLFLPFRRKNFSSLLKTRQKYKGHLNLIINAVVARYKWNTGTQEPRLEACVAVNNRQKQVEIRSRHFVIAAGAIESTRILLEIRRQSEGMLMKGSDLLGHYLSDHLSSNVAHTLPNDTRAIAKLFGPRFFRNDMRSFRFIDQENTPDSPRSFFHFIFELNNPGFALAKKVLSGLQSKKMPSLTFSEVSQSIISIMALGCERLLSNRLHIPSDTPTHLQLDIEQTPSFENRIELSNQTDRYGRFKSKIHWKIVDEDIRKIEDTALRFINKWPKDSKKLPRLYFNQPQSLGSKPHDAYHPVGTCRMGTNNEVVDMNLKVRGLNNVFVLSTAVFPSAGSANPTFSMLCLGEELAQLINRIQY